MLPGQSPPPTAPLNVDLEAADAEIVELIEPLLARVREEPGDAGRHGELGLALEANGLRMQPSPRTGRHRRLTMATRIGLITRLS